MSRYRLRLLVRTLLRDPELRPGRRALRQAIFYYLNPEIHSLVRALEGGSYSAAKGNLVEGSELKIESLDAVMECVTFDERNLRFWTPAETRERKIRGGS